MTVPLLTRFSSVRLRQKAHSPKCWCKLGDFPNGIIKLLWRSEIVPFIYAFPFDKDGIWECYIEGLWYLPRADFWHKIIHKRFSLYIIYRDVFVKMVEN